MFENPLFSLFFFARANCWERTSNFKGNHFFFFSLFFVSLFFSPLWKEKFPGFPSRQSSCHKVLSPTTVVPFFRYSQGGFIGCMWPRQQEVDSRCLCLPRDRETRKKGWISKFRVFFFQSPFVSHFYCNNDLAIVWSFFKTGFRGRPSCITMRFLPAGGNKYCLTLQ